MSASSRNSEPDIDPAMVLAFMAGCAALLVLCLVAVEVPVLVWSLVHLRPVLLSPVDAIGGGLQYLFSGDHMAYPRALRGVRELLPPPGAWVVLNATGLLTALVGRRRPVS